MVAVRSVDCELILSLVSRSIGTSETGMETFELVGRFQVRSLRSGLERVVRWFVGSKARQYVVRKVIRSIEVDCIVAGSVGGSFVQSV